LHQHHTHGTLVELNMVEIDLDFSNETGVPPCEEHDISERDDSAIGKVSYYAGELPACQCRERSLSESDSMFSVSV